MTTEQQKEFEGIQRRWNENHFDILDPDGEIAQAISFLLMLVTSQEQEMKRHAAAAISLVLDNSHAEEALRLRMR